MNTRALLAILLLASGVSCKKTGETEAPVPAPDRSFALLTVNDIYRIEGLELAGTGGLDRLRTLRAELEAEHPDLLLLHGGDVLYPSFMSRAFDGDQMIDVLNRLDGDVQAFDDRLLVVFGNHEFDKDDLEDAALLDTRIEESGFRWVQGNIRFSEGDDGAPLVAAENLIPWTVETLNGVRVGVFGLTIDSAQPAYVDGFDDPEETAREMTAFLRAEPQSAEVVVALTHREMAADLDLTGKLGPDGPDLTIGGHDHARMIDKRAGADGVERWVIKADADAVSAALVEVTLRGDGSIDVENTYKKIGVETGPEPDPEVAERIAWWQAEHDRVFCEGAGEELGCLSARIGYTQVELVAEETEIRRFETNLGDWAADEMLAAYADAGAQIAFINSGSLRLNQNIPADNDVTRSHIEQLFAYPSPVQLIEIDGDTLQRVVDRAVSNWSGSGHWLQIAGFAYRHDPQGNGGVGAATELTILGPDGPRPVDPKETLIAAVGDYLVNPDIGDQDGYIMLSPDDVITQGEPPDLKVLLSEALEAAGDEGVAPELQGRICNTTREGPCLLPEAE